MFFGKKENKTLQHQPTTFNSNFQLNKNSANGIATRTEYQYNSTESLLPTYD